MNVLLTGGAGYIGSHTYVELIKAGFSPVILDNFCNAKHTVLARLEALTQQSVLCVNADIRDPAALDHVFTQWQFAAVIHFAGLKAVGESVNQPLLYYDHNVIGTLCLLKAMQAAHVKRLVFSSSATVYGDPHTVPILENFPRSATNPYGRSKWIIETMLEDLYQSDSGWDIALLRYFNPVGAHESSLIGEDPQGVPNNLMPFIAQVAVGKREKLLIFGNDYPTPDGTGVRDYIHVMDLAKGHVKALEKLKSKTGLLALNLGTGQGYSVLDMVRTFEKVSARPIPYQIVGRRSGDIAICYASPDQAFKSLGWKAEKGLYEMCKDSWHWQSKNPNGYEADGEG